MQRRSLLSFASFALALNACSGGGGAVLGGFNTSVESGQSKKPAPPAASPSPAATPTASSAPTSTPIASTLSETPAQADRFVDIVGADSHFNYSGTPYITAFPEISALLLGSGIRHLRDGRPTTDSGYLSRLAYLGQHGIKHNIGFSISDGSALVASELQKQMPYVDFIEPANEYDGYKNTDLNWVANLRAQQQVLFDTRNGNLAFAGIDVVGPAMTSLIDYGSLGTYDSIEDNGNLHFATCSLNPGNTAGSGHSSFPYAETFTRLSTVSKPMWTTETGYNSQVGVRPCAIPDDIIAKYDPRMIAERFNGGDKRVYFYQLVDMPTDPVFGGTGLIDATGVAKPQFTAVSSLLNKLADPGAAFTTTSLSYALTAPPDVHHTLLQKRDGTYDLLLWREDSAWQSTTTNIGGTPIVVPPTTVTVTTPNASALQYSSYDASWTLQPSGFTRSSAHTYSVTVTDAISVLELR